MTDRVRQIVADVIGIPVNRLTADAGHEVTEGWDSLAQIKIVMGIENDFGVVFSAEQVQGLNSVAKIVRALTTE